MRLWQKDREQYIRQYVNGEESPTSKEMMLGTIIHNALENPYYNWRKALEENDLLIKEQIVLILLGKMAFKRLEQGEFGITAKTKSGIILFSKFDGFDKKNKILGEYKTSERPELWSQRIVDMHLQLTFYAYVYRLTYRSFFREIQLHYLNTAKGTVKTYITSRGLKDLQYIEKMIEQTVSEMKQEGIWEKRMSKADKVLKATNTLFPELKEA